MNSKMKYRELGTTGIKASVIGLGTFAIGGWFWGGTDEKKAIEAITASLDMGINLIDTAPIYGFGRAERIVGQAIKGKRDRVVLATKCGLRWDTDKGEFDGYADEASPRKDPAKYEIHRYLGPESIRYEVEQSLKRLGTDYIDLYQTHWQEKTTPIEVTMETLLKLKDEGKIRAIGVSNVNVDQLKRYGKVASAQEKFSLMDRRIEREGLVDYCLKNHLSILSYFTMERGLLTGKMQSDRKFAEGDTRKTDPSYTAANIEKVNKVMAELKPFADKYKATIAQIVIALTYSQKGISHVLIGARDSVQAKENAQGGYVELLPQDLDAMNIIVRGFNS